MFRSNLNEFCGFTMVPARMLVHPTPQVSNFTSPRFSKLTQVHQAHRVVWILKGLPPVGRGKKAERKRRKQKGVGVGSLWEKNKSGAVWIFGAEVLTVPKIIRHWTAQNISNLRATLKPPPPPGPRPSSSDIGTGQTELARREQTVFHIDGSEVVRHNL